jgi:dipeptidyl aminopeptidase/acylaminoacyl peptidase
MVNCDTGLSTRYTFGEVNDHGPVWSADGEYVAFISTRNKKTGIYIIPANGGGEQRIIEADGVFAYLNWTPDGRQLVYMFHYNDSHFETDDKKKKEAPLFRHITRLSYCYDGIGFIAKDKWQIWKVDIENNHAKRLTKGRRDNIFPTVSPNGKLVAYVSNRDPDALNLLSYDLFVTPINGGNERKIPTPPGPVWFPVFSPDSGKLAYLGHDQPDTNWGHTHMHIWVVGLSGKSRAKNLTPGFDRSAENLTLTDIGQPEFYATPRWSADGKRIYFQADDTGNAHVFYARISGGNPVRVIKKKCHVKAFDVNSRTKNLAAVVADARTPGNICLMPSKQAGDSGSKQLTAVNKKFLSNTSFPKTREVWFRGYDGTPLQGWIVTPPDFNQRRNYPAILEIHGGPRCQYGFTFFHEFLCLASQGYVVFYTNPRGGGGRGKEFVSAIFADWGSVDYDDCMAATDYLCRLPYVDKNRLGVAGGSYGGYMTNWIIGHTNRFKAAVAQRSVSNLATDVGSSCHGFSFHRTFGGWPWEVPEVYRKCSPLTYAKDIKTPLLIIHSDNDLNVKSEQAEQLFVTLKLMKKKVEMVRFPEESHGLTRHGRPDRRIARLGWILKWFDRYLK